MVRMTIHIYCLTTDISGIYFVISNEIIWKQPRKSVYAAVFHWAERKYTCFRDYVEFWDKPRTNFTYENNSNPLSSTG